MAPVIQTMFSEWSELVKTLRELERRIEILQIHQDLDDQEKSLHLEETNSLPPADQQTRHYYRADYDQVDGNCLSRTRTVPDKVRQEIGLALIGPALSLLRSHWSRAS